MPMYRVNFIYNLADEGWTETYYRSAASGRLATLFDAQELQWWMESRPHVAKLAAIRAQEVDGLRRVYLRELGLQGLHDDPDVTSTAAVLALDFSGTAGRNIWFRGLSDHLVKRRADGRDDPQPAFRLNLVNLNLAIQRFNLRGRQIVNSRRWSHAFEFRGDDNNPQITRARVRENFEAVAGNYVYFGKGPVLGIVPERAYLVVDREPTELLLANPWQPSLGVQVPDKPVRLRVLEYDYPLLDNLRFKFFRKHTTGPAYRPVSWVADGTQRMPMHACGRIIDRLRTCYQTEMRPFRHDAGITVPVRWYFVPEGRAAVPYEHPFASRNWELQTDYPTLLGEVYERSHYSGRAPIELNGIGLCGSRDAWENGAGPAETIKPINPTTGQPCCCGPGVLNVSGGAAAGTRPPAVIVKGGAVAGGRFFEVNAADVEVSVESLVTPAYTAQRVYGLVAGGGAVVSIPINSITAIEVESTAAVASTTTPSDSEVVVEASAIIGDSHSTDTNVNVEISTGLEFEYIEILPYGRLPLTWIIEFIDQTGDCDCLAGPYEMPHFSGVQWAVEIDSCTFPDSYFLTMQPPFESLDDFLFTGFSTFSPTSHSDNPPEMLWHGNMVFPCTGTVNITFRPKYLGE